MIIFQIIIALLIAIIFWKSIVAILEMTKKTVGDNSSNELEKSLANDLVDVVKNGNGDIGTRIKIVLGVAIMLPFALILYLVTKPFRMMLGDEKADEIFKRIPMYTKARGMEGRGKVNKDDKRRSGL